MAEGADPEEAFHALHQRRYGHARRRHEVELVTLRVRAVGKVAHPVEVPAAPATAPPPAEGERPVRFGGNRMQAGLYRRSRLAPGHRLPGPVIVADSGSTTWVPPGWRLKVDDWGNLCLEPAGKEEMSA